MSRLERLDARWKAVDPAGWLDVCTDAQWGIVLQGSIIIHPHSRHHVGADLAEALESAERVVALIEEDQKTA